MNTYYLRNTHAPCGEGIKAPGEDDEEREAEFLAMEEGAFVVRMLEPDQPMTFPQVIEAIRKYNYENDEPPMPRERIALGLCEALWTGFAKAISI